MLKANLPLAALALLAGCITPAPLRPAAEGSEVPLNQRVQVGALLATPQAVVEDSRCPQNARCVWAGRLTVATRIDGPGWHETARLTLGQRHETHGTWITLVSGVPEKDATAPTPLVAYRFSFEGWSAPNG